MSNQELVVSDQTYMPAMSIPQAVARFNTLVEFVQTVMRENVDYGLIPGTNNKPTLLKPGAEKLTTLFGLTTRFVVVEKTEDWTGEQHGGDPFFYYWYRCQLWRGDRLIAEADGSCNSRETKYRWREAKRVCPSCNQPSIIKGKAEYGGGWLCFKKQGGCGAKYGDGDQAVEGQPAGRVANPDVCDLVNTLQKMSQKRALIAATLIGVNASEFFTQDLDDLPVLGNGASYVPPTQTVNTVTGEVIDQEARDDADFAQRLGKKKAPNPAQQNPRRAALLVRMAALVEEAEAMGVQVVDADKHGSKTEAELITAGTRLRATLDTLKRQRETDQVPAGQQLAVDTSEWDAIEASAAKSRSNRGSDDLL